MNFHSDDPLADLLSDEDNDSFFDNCKKISKASVKATSKSDDLFGIRDETAVPNVTGTKTAPLEYSETKIGEYDDNVDLGFDPKKPKAGKKSANIFDDILGSMDRAEALRPATSKSTLSRQSTDHRDTTNIMHTQVRPKTSTGRRNSDRSTGTNLDPLGLFMESIKEEVHVAASDRAASKLPKKRGTTADWLGLSVTSDQDTEASTNVVAESELPKTTKALVPIENKENEKEPANVDILKPPTEMVTQESSGHHIPDVFLESRLQLPQRATSSPAPAQNIMLLNTMNAEAQNACNLLQQQEFQLALATQMKQQEQSLMEMRRKQEALLQQQEQQFNTLLQQQIHRQQQLEEHIKSQQQRITNHIQLLMTQPALMNFQMKTTGNEEVGAETSIGGFSKTPQPQQVVSLEIVHLEADLKRLELEKLRLEELVENIRVNYEKEMEMMENSFKKQLKVLEEHLTSVETRLKSEIEELHSFYGKKLEALAEDKEKLKADYEAQVTTLKQDHDDELRKLRKSQDDDLDMLREEHRRMLETIRQAKAVEFAAVQENGSYLETLKAASKNLANVSDGMEMLRDEMQSKIETINRDRERTLDIREKRLEDAEKRLQLTEASAEDEKRRLMELVSTLEVQLGRKVKESEDENWILRQQMATLEAERAAFEREKIVIREQFARDEKRIAELKDQQLLGAQRQLIDLQDEQMRLNVERTKLETERRLQQPNDLEKQRLEIEATLQVAQNASRQADVERLRYHRMQRDLEKIKRDLMDKDNRLCVKEEEIEQELHAMRAAERKSLETQHRAHAAEQNFKAKIKILQQRMVELGEKETQLSQEQLLLAQERINLQNLKKQIEQQKCALCKMSKLNTEMAKMLYTDEPNISGVASANVIAEGEADKKKGDATNGGGGGDDKYRNTMNRGNVVERILDDNIAESCRRMRQSLLNSDYYTESVLDDDSKKLVLRNLDVDFDLKNMDSLNK